MAEKSNLVLFAENELARLGDDEGQSAMNKHILEMVRVFSDENHSGFTAYYALGILERLLRFLPLSAINDYPEDWADVGGGLYQHKRCSRVFKMNGRAWDVDGMVFSSDNGITWFTNSKSHTPVSFPYLVPTYPKKYLVFENGDIMSEYKD